MRSVACGLGAIKVSTNRSICYFRVYLKRILVHCAFIKLRLSLHLSDWTLCVVPAAYTYLIWLHYISKYTERKPTLCENILGFKAAWIYFLLAFLCLWVFMRLLILMRNEWQGSEFRALDGLWSSVFAVFMAGPQIQSQFMCAHKNNLKYFKLNTLLLEANVNCLALLLHNDKAL